MKNLLVTLLLIISTTSARAGEYTLKCVSEDQKIEIQANSLLVTNQGIAIGDGLIDLKMPMDYADAFFFQKVDYFKKIDFEITGFSTDRTRYFRIETQRRHMSYTVWSTKGEGVVLEHVEQRASCKIFGPDGNEVRR
jgi:hypothetical protein